MLITRQALGQGPMPMDMGALDVKGKGKGKAKDKPDAEMTCYYCGKVGHRKADCWCWQAAQKKKEKEKPATRILSVEVAEVNESWTARNEDLVMVDSGASVSGCPVDYAPECEVSSGSIKLPLVGAGGDRIEHIGQKTVGYATRDGANVEIAFEAAKVRRPLLSVDGSVHGLWWLHHPEDCTAGDPAVRKLNMKRQNGHFWPPLARRVEASVNPVMVAPIDGAAEGQDVDEKMDEGCPWKSGLLEWCESHASTHQRSGQLTRVLTCRSVTGVPTASRAEHLTQATGSRTERRTSRRWCRSTTSLLRRR